MADTIDRDELLNVYKGYKDFDKIYIGSLRAEIKAQPSVTPKQSTEALKAEIKRMKRTFTICINSDYYTGYMSALSAVEGYIAQSEGYAE